MLRLGAGVYAKACRDESTHEVAHKLKAKVIDGGDGTQVLGHGAVQYVNDRNRRAFTATRRKPSGTASFPTTDVGNYVRGLAAFLGVRYVPTAADQWAETVTLKNYTNQG